MPGRSQDAGRAQPQACTAPAGQHARCTATVWGPPECQGGARKTRKHFMCAASDAPMSRMQMERRDPRPLRAPGRRPLRASCGRSPRVAAMHPAAESAPNLTCLQDVHHVGPRRKECPDAWPQRPGCRQSPTAGLHRTSRAARKVHCHGLGASRMPRRCRKDTNAHHFCGIRCSDVENADEAARCLSAART